MASLAAAATSSPRRNEAGGAGLAADDAAATRVRSYAQRLLTDVRKPEVPRAAEGARRVLKVRTPFAFPARLSEVTGAGTQRHWGLGAAQWTGTKDLGKLAFASPRPAALKRQRDDEAIVPLF
jgi:hypothetical protein